jgi:ribosomal protein L37AE/L43A
VTHEELKALAQAFIDQGVPSALMTTQGAAGYQLAEGYLALSVKLEEAEKTHGELDYLRDVVLKQANRITELLASRGEIVKACPECRAVINDKIWKFQAGMWSCHSCSAAFAEPTYYQRVSGPTT